MRYVFVLILLLPIIGFGQTPDSSPFNEVLVDLTSAASRIVIETPQVSPQDRLRARTILSQAQSLDELAETNRCSTIIGVTEHEEGQEIRVNLADSDISGLPFHLQMSSLIQQYPSLEQHRDQIGTYSSLLTAYRESLISAADSRFIDENGVRRLLAQNQGEPAENNDASQVFSKSLTGVSSLSQIPAMSQGQSADEYINSLNSTDLALLLSRFAQDRYQLYLPAGLLTIETVSNRIAQNTQNLANAFRGVGSLSLQERLGIIHVLSNRVREDVGAGSTEMSRTQRIGQYFSNAGFSDGIIVRERVRNQEKISLYVYNEAEGRMVRHVYEGDSSTIINSAEQGFFGLDGRPISNSSVSGFYRAVLQDELIAGPPHAWTQGYVPTDETQVSFSGPSVVTPTDNGLPIIGATPTPGARVQGAAAINLRTGVGSGLITGDNANLIRPTNNAFTDIGEVNLPLASSTNGSIGDKPSGPNPIGLALGGNAGLAELPESNNILIMGLNTDTQSGDTTVNVGASRSNGEEAYGINFNSTFRPEGEDSLTGNAFIQNNPIEGNLRSYGASLTRDNCNTRARGFFSVDNSDTSDPENIVRGTRFTGEVSGNISNCRNGTSGVTGRFGTSVPVGDSDTVVATVELDSNEGLSGYSANYSTTTEGGTTLTAGVVRNGSGDTNAIRVDRTNTNIILSNNTTTDGTTTNTLIARQNLDPLLPDNVNAVGTITLVRGDGGSSNTYDLQSAVAPFGEEDSLLVTVRYTRQDRRDNNDQLLRNSTRTTFNIFDTVEFDDREIGSLQAGAVFEQERTPGSTTDRQVYNAQLTIGADSSGNPNDSVGGLSANLGVTYTDEQTVSFNLANLGEQDKGGKGSIATITPVATDSLGNATDRTRFETRLSVQQTFDGPGNYEAAARVGVAYFTENLSRGGTIDMVESRQGLEIGGEVEIYDPASNGIFYASLIRSDTEIGNPQIFRNREFSQFEDSETRFLVGFRVRR